MNDWSRGQLFSTYILPTAAGGKAVRSLDRDFVFPDDVAVYAKNGDAAQIGIDVSHHNLDGCNCSINWSTVYDQGARFVYIKASQGISGYDPRLVDYWKGIDALPPSKKLYKGAYHFLSADGSGEMQAKWFLKNLDARLASIGNQRKIDDLPAVVDLEWDHRVNKKGQQVPCADGKIHNDCWQIVAPNEIIARLTAWATVVEAETGKKPVIYTAKSWVRERIKDENKFSKIGTAKIWIADYVPHDKNGRDTLLTVKPRVPQGTVASLWQFSDRAQFSNKAKPQRVDANLFKGTVDDFKVAFQLPK
ncbi:GH25 family lysozyme [Burkholderia sp. Leaf177]|uniref:GH25 family lysozyme n=1 Tax=Burkholderia sp. Leaf177 TaxID=1736287 RepID=UPI00138F23F3|nr:GH25 family lysozyme [Burkholderia sp. Leaf177]